MKWIESYQRDFPDLEVTEDAGSGALTVTDPHDSSTIIVVLGDQWAFYWGMMVGNWLAHDRTIRGNSKEMK